MTSRLGDQLHGDLADEYPAVEPLSPGERADVAILVHGVLPVPGMKLLPQRRPRVRIGAMIQ